MLLDSHGFSWILWDPLAFLRMVWIHQRFCGIFEDFFGIFEDFFGIFGHFLDIFLDIFCDFFGLFLGPFLGIFDVGFCRLLTMDWNRLTADR